MRWPVLVGEVFSISPVNSLTILPLVQPIMEAYGFDMVWFAMLIAIGILVAVPEIALLLPDTMLG